MLQVDPQMVGGKDYIPGIALIDIALTKRGAWREKEIGTNPCKRR